MKLILKMPLIISNIDELGYLTDWKAVRGHPDTGVKFAGQTIPGFSGCVTKALELHRKVPYVLLVGWDFCVEADGSVALFEWNGWYSDTKFSEGVQGPCFADLGWEKFWRD